MKQQRILQWLVGVVIFFSLLATLAGILSHAGSGSFEYRSIRGDTISIWGRGIYRHMSGDVAPQGIAQDLVTLLLAIPLLAYAAWQARRRRLLHRILLAGVLGYFLVTYLFYTVMGMYNEYFLVYVVLMGTSFYAFILSLQAIPLHDLPLRMSKVPVRLTGWVLICIASAIAVLWLGIVVPPLLNGTIYPEGLAHYTTLIVQGLDLGLLLPAAFISAVLWMQRKPVGFLLLPVYFVFLSVLMTALSAKVVAMWWLGYPVVPVIYIIPAFNLATVLCSVIILQHTRRRKVFIQKKKHEAFEAV